MNEECGNGEGPDSEDLRDTLRYINLTGLGIGLVTLCGPIHLRVCMREDRGNGEGTGSAGLSDTRYINLIG